MNVNQAIINVKSCVFPTVESRVLANEVERLREQRKILSGVIPFFETLPKEVPPILDEINKEEKKEMTVDEALTYVEKVFNPDTAARTLANEVRRICVVNRGLLKEIKEKDISISQLYEIIDARDEMIKALEKNRQQLGDNLKSIHREYFG